MISYHLARVIPVAALMSVTDTSAVGGAHELHGTAELRRRVFGELRAVICDVCNALN